RLGGRHADVDHRDIGLELGDAGKQLLGVPGLRNDVESVLGENPGDAFAHENGVVREDHTHGISARSWVPPAAGLEIVSQPPSASIRSRRPPSPPPGDGVAPPAPSSATTTTARSPSRSTTIRTCDAEACFVALARASAATKYAAVSTAVGSLVS